jgi:hypothetical protein
VQPAGRVTETSYPASGRVGKASARERNKLSASSMVGERHRYEQSGKRRARQDTAEPIKCTIQPAARRCGKETSDRRAP